MITNLDDIPGIRAAKANGNINYIELKVEDTSPTITEGFNDEEVSRMSQEALQAQLKQIENEEQSLIQMHTDLNQRRSKILNILKRKGEIS